jgi:hypothetical protein
MIRTTGRTAIIIASVFIVMSISIAIGDNGSNDASVGYITNIEIVARTQTSHWEGYYGIITAGSSSVYPDYFNKSKTDINTIRKLELGAKVQEGDLILITNSRKAPVLSELRAGKISTIDAITGKYSDSGTRTFTSNSSYIIPSIGKTIKDVPTAYSFVDSKQQVEDFREGLFRDNEGNLILIVPISSAPKIGYDNASYVFQFIVPNNYSNPQKYYICIM